MFPIYCSFPLCRESLFENTFELEWAGVIEFYQPFMSHLCEQNKRTAVVMLKDPHCRQYHAFHLQCASIIPILDSWELESEAPFNCPSGTCDGIYNSGDDLMFFSRQFYMGLALRHHVGHFVDLY